MTDQRVRRGAGFPCQAGWGCREKTLTKAAQNAGRSSGLRLVTSVLAPAWQTSTSLSTQVPFSTSVRRLG